jgi:hypothetical protein
VLRTPIIILFSLFVLPGFSQLPDSLSLPVDSLVQHNLQKLDSIHRAADTQFSKLKYEYDSIANSMASAGIKVQQMIDSLNTLNLPTDKYEAKLDSLHQATNEKLTRLQSKADELKRKTIGQIDDLDLPPELTSELKDYTSALDELDITLPGIGTEFPTLSIEKFEGLSLPDTNLKLPTDFGDIKLAEQLGEIKDITGNVKGFQDVLPETPNIEGVAEKIEEQVGELAAEKFGDLSGIPTVPAGEEAAREMIVEEVKRQARSHFAGKEQQIQSAMDQLSKYKEYYENVEDIKDLPDKKPNPMKDKSLAERLVPGLSFQIQKKTEWWFDFNPYVGYRFNGRLTAGIGWNHRVAYNFDSWQVNHEATIYGIRLYSEYEITEGLKPRLEIESMNTPVRTLPDQTYNHREWVFSAMIGLKKEYRISSKLRGNAQVLYNLYNPDYKSPYVERWNFRIGFEMHLNKKAHSN